MELSVLQKYEKDKTQSAEGQSRMLAAIRTDEQAAKRILLHTYRETSFKRQRKGRCQMKLSFDGTQFLEFKHTDQYVRLLNPCTQRVIFQANHHHPITLL